MARSTAGFTLLEALVAFIIAALALTALYNAGLGGLGAASESARTMEAVSRAESHLEAASRGDALVSGDRQGDEGAGFHWHVRISPSAASAAAPAQNQPILTLYTVSAAISWVQNGRGRTVELDTQRLAASPPPPP